MHAKDIMTKKVVSITPETKVKSIAHLLHKNNYTGLPVLKNGKIVGIVTQYDLMSQEAGFHIPSYIKFLESFDVHDGRHKQKISKDFKQILNTKAKDIMTRKVFKVYPDTPVRDLAALILSKQINPVPVINNQSKMIGIISRSDIVKLFTPEYNKKSK